MNIAVVGLGKLGLPLAVQYASMGHRVVGVDTNSHTVALVNDGVEPSPGEADLGKMLTQVLHGGALVAATSFAEAIPLSEVVVVVVPVLVGPTNEIDFRALDEATESIGAELTDRTLVIYETTLPIGTTRQRLAPKLAQVSGLKEERDFHVVFSPERVLTGRVFEDLRKYPKIIGGLTDAGARKAREFYNSVIDFDDRPDLPSGNGVWDLGSAESAEMVKLAETTYRDVNIGLANQFAVHAESAGIDIYSVIDACNSQPYSQIHRPGISVGGHCIPVYPHLYMSTDNQRGVVAASRDVNIQMPKHAVNYLSEMLGGLGNKRILILGVSYRPNVKEAAFSGAFALRDEITQLGGQTFVLDPIYSLEEIVGLGFSSGFNAEDIDGIILHTAHEDFLAFSDANFPNCAAVFDGRNFLDPKSWTATNFHVLGKPKTKV